MAISFDVSKIQKKLAEKKEGVQKTVAELKANGFKKNMHDFWYGKPHTAEPGGRRSCTRTKPACSPTVSGAASRIRCTTCTRSGVTTISTWSPIS